MEEISLFIKIKNGSYYAKVPLSVIEKFNLEQGNIGNIRLGPNDGDGKSVMQCKLTKFDGFLVRKEHAELFKLKEGSIVHALL